MNDKTSDRLRNDQIRWTTMGNKLYIIFQLQQCFSHTCVHHNHSCCIAYRTNSQLVDTLALLYLQASSYEAADSGRRAVHMIVVAGFMSILHRQQNICTCTCRAACGNSKPTKRSCTLHRRTSGNNRLRSFVRQHSAHEKRCNQHIGCWKHWTNLSLATIIQNTKCSLVQLQRKEGAPTADPKFYTSTTN